MSAPTGDLPKTLPCTVCGRKPRRETICWSYGDSNNEFTLICIHGAKPGKAKDFIRVPDPLKQFLTERQVVDLWNAQTTPQAVADG